MNSKIVAAVVAVAAVVGGSALMFNLGGNESETTVTPTSSVSSAEDPTYKGRPITDVAPDGLIVGGSGDGGGDVPVIDGDPDGVELNPEKLSTPDPKGQLPPDFTPPAGAKFNEQTTSRKGYNSYVVLVMEKPWEEAVADLRASMEKDGWKCFQCMPFVVESDSDGAMKDARYMLNMTNGEHEVLTLISVASNGFTIASLTFQG